MNQVLEFISTNRILYLATIGVDNKPKVRPFQFMLEHAGRFYFCTSNKKQVYQQIQLHPYVEFSTTGPDGSWIRLSGRAVFSHDLKIKEKILNQNPLVKSIYETASNPEFEIFYLEGDIYAEICDFSGKPPQVFHF